LKTYLQISLSLFFVLFIISCTESKDTVETDKKEDKVPSNQNKDVISNIRKYWPEGTFVQYFDNEKYIYIERWVKNKNIYLMEGSYMQLKPFIDTLFRMWGKLILDSDDLIKMYYKTNLSSDEIEFVLSKNDERVFVFENPFRSFPSIMKYSFESDSSFEVLERGFLNGAEKETIYRVKLLK
jgi:hypothetical protein